MDAEKREDAAKAELLDKLAECLAELGCLASHAHRADRAGLARGPDIARFALALLAGAGIRRAVVNVHHLPDEMAAAAEPAMIAGPIKMTKTEIRAYNAALASDDPAYIVCNKSAATGSMVVRTTPLPVSPMAVPSVKILRACAKAPPVSSIWLTCVTRPATRSARCTVCRRSKVSASQVLLRGVPGHLLQVARHLGGEPGGEAQADR